MGHFLVPYFFIALVSDPLINKSEYFFKFKSTKEKQLDFSTNELIETTARLRCKVVQLEAIRCNFDNFAVITDHKPQNDKLDLLRVARWNCTNIQLCGPFEITFHSTGVKSLIMGEDTKSMPAVSEIVNLLNVKWVEAVSKQTFIQENTLHGECNSRILVQHFNQSDDIIKPSLFQSELTLKSNGSITEVYKKMRDVNSCSRGKVKLSEGVFSSLEYFEQTSVSSVYSIESCIEKKTIFTMGGSKFYDKLRSCLTVDKVQLITDHQVSKITDASSVPFYLE